MPCAIPPLDMSVARIGRGRGVGFNRLCSTATPAQRIAQHCVADQLHAGLDILATRGSPIVVPVTGTVVVKSLDSAAVPGMSGYGNAIAIRVDDPVPGLPTPFYYSLNHMDAPSPLVVGQRVEAGTVAGVVGGTTNRRFPGTPPHLHLEVRTRPFGAGGSYDRDTVDPAIMFQGVGIDWVGHHLVGGRQSGGQLLVRIGGPSDCRTTMRGLSALEAPFRKNTGFSKSSDLAIIYGSFTSGQAGPGEQYIPPAALSPNYPGTTSPGPEVPDPPTYDSATSTTPATPSSSGGNGLLWAGAGVLVLVALAKR